MDAAIKQNDDPNRFLWYFIYLMISFVSALPLFGLRLNDFGINYLFLLFIHEFSSFLFFGHTFFSTFGPCKFDSINLKKWVFGPGLF